VHKQYKDFVDKSQREVNFGGGDEVWLNIKKFRLPKKFEPQVLGSICKSTQSVGKKNLDIYKLELLENLTIHPIFHVSFFKSVNHDASRPNIEQNSRPPPEFIDNKPNFEMETMLKSKQLRG
jgi:hypothetical protein